MSRIAIIDTAIDNNYINGRVVEHFNLCEESSNRVQHQIGHGTLCAMVLDHCATNYDLINIQIFKDYKSKVFGEIEILSKALKLCQELKIDVISLSAVSSLLSDSKYLFDITNKLSDTAVIVSALDNKRYVSVPTAYPHVIGVGTDSDGLLLPGDIACSVKDPFGANVYANCDFSFLREQLCAPSNSFAVPVVAAYANNLINQGEEISNIKSLLQNLKPYSLPKKREEASCFSSPDTREIPYVFIVDDETKTCCALMDSLYEKYEVQSAALSLTDGPYDVRVRTVDSIEKIQHDLYFMEHHYKTDIIFIIGSEFILSKVRQNIVIDIELVCKSDGQASICYEGNIECGIISNIPDRLHKILTS